MDRPYSSTQSSASLQSDRSKDQRETFTNPRPPDPTSDSVKSDRSRKEPLDFGTRPYSSTQSSASLQSDRSKGLFETFTNPRPPDPTSDSVKSDRSRKEPLDFGTRPYSSTQSSASLQSDRSKGLFETFTNPRPPDPTSDSVKSDRSRKEPLDFGARPYSSTQSSASLQSDRSKGLFETFTNPRPPDPTSDSVKSDSSRKEPLDFGTRPYSSTQSSASLQSDRSKGLFETFTNPSFPDCDEEETEDEMGFPLSSQGDSGQDRKCIKKCKTDVKESLDTEIFETDTNKVKTLDTLFIEGRTVLTIGVAGIGKTFQAKKYLKVLAKKQSKESKTTWKMYLDFEELNSKEPQSIEDLLNNDGKEFNYSDYNMTIILDGLDKCELPLDLKHKEVTDNKERVPVDELLTNLLRGNLLPSARLWILTRPSGENKIPADYISKVTECRETVERQKSLISSLMGRFNTRENKNTSKRNTEHIFESKKAEPQKITSVSDLFKSDQEEIIRTVLTVAEEGMSFHVQKLIEDWSKKKSVLNKMKSAASSLFLGKGKDEIVLLFPLKSSELPLEKDVSFVELLNHVFEETKQCVMSDYNKLNTVFILDGLDDFKVDFSDSVNDVNTAAPVSVLLSSLIRGDLLPSAHLWITSRPAAAAKLPPDLIHRTTQIRDKDAKDELSKQLKAKIKQEVKREPIETELFEITPNPSENKIKYSDLLNRRGVRTLLTRGVPRIGKTFHTNQFKLDWAEGKCSPDTNLVLSIQLSELKGNMSLENLLNKCLDCGVSKGRYYKEYKMTIILDGLDKCELPLDFKNNKKVTDIREEAPVDELLTNLLEGNLLPSAKLWILTRGNKIPEDYIHKVTECRETTERQQRLASKLKKVLPSVFVFKDDLSHPNQKDTEHIRADGVQENGKKKQITMSDLFKGEENRQIRTVLTIGEADVGKSYLVCKFVHEWSKPSSNWFACFLRTNEKSTMLFPFKYSLFDRLPQTLSFVELLNHVFKETKQCVMSDYNKLNTVFILDGLDDFKVDFSDSVNDVNTAAPVSVLLSSLIRGDLLPSAHLWITSRPAAAAKLPLDLIYRTTQIREKPDVVTQRNLKKALMEQFEFVAEGVDRCASNSASLKNIYTDLYIIEGESGEVYQQSETRLVQQAKNIEMRKEVPINYKDIFKPSSDKAEIKTVLTTGVAGIGKTFSSMKYMLDWAEGPTSQNINLIFPLPFRELNLRKDMEYSLEELLHQFFPCMKTSEITNYEQYKILIVLDGLDECRLDLNFGKYSILKGIQEKATVRDLLTNLIVGNLLPKAQVWITSRPAASLCIPNDKVHRATEVRGFNNEQKEEYFRKRFDPDLAEKILLCLKESRSIYLMGYIPVFCWIAANVLECFVQNDHQGAPKTLTDLFIHFLLLQCRQANSKYDEATEEGSKICNEGNVKTILGLSELAFEELKKGDLLFTEEDLKSYGLNAEEASVYSGLLTKIKRNESELYPKPLFSFVHLSIQEFLAAFYVSYMFNNEGKNVFCFSSNESDSSCSASDFYKSVVDKALESKNGDWDLFLRFLVGLSLKANQDLLKDLIKTPENTAQINEETIAYIKTKIDEGSDDADMSMNLFHCLNELNDHSLVKEIKKYLNSEKNDYENFSPTKWSALTFVLLTSDEKLDVFDLKKYLKSEKVLLGMMPVVKVATKALLSWCELSELSCTGLSSVLISPSSNLTELDLSHNELMDSGVAELSEGVKSFHCKLKILRLAGCRVSVKGCSSLTLALRSNRSSHLEELDLSYNHPGPEEQNLKALENDPNAKLKNVCLDHCCEHRLKPGLKKYTADLTFDGRFKHPRIIVEGQKAKTWKNVTEWIPEAKGVRVRHVFCEQELKGLCYWELEWDGTVGIGVSYKGAAAKSVIGFDHNSWAVFCSNQPHSCLKFDTQKRPHRKICEFPSKKMALYLNWEAGTLSYYSVTEGKLTLITTFKATAFKEPLVPTFWLHSGSVSLVSVSNETEPE